MSFKLQQTKQCKNCPWRVDSDPYAINGYSLQMHQDLTSTIADPGVITFSKEIRAMACHNSTDEQQFHCIGWLVHQLGVGNNIGLRMYLRNCENASEIEVFGEQHQRLEDTLPNEECETEIDWDD
ncbi:DUF6283 family protein [Acaryochloris marina]|uniref:DUF6283 family protein n=1 Tax=Acaryochloris marina TaxID=155978 RepID=UPI001BAEDE7A|nr:DUF6283 family protein [Acaryochloris marina]QUY46284.1 hypothetical protein I1H34_31785 [Acaryochloris marina S15]